MIFELVFQAKVGQLKYSIALLLLFIKREFQQSNKEASLCNTITFKLDLL